MADLVERPGGPAPPPIFRRDRGPKGGIFLETGPPRLSQDLDDRTFLPLLIGRSGSATEANRSDSTANKKTIVEPKSKMKRVRFTLNLSFP